MAGVGIAVAGSLLPRLVKTFFPPERVGLVTGLYMFAMMGAAALASAASAPLADRLGSWQASLASWALLALIGLLVGPVHAAREPAPHTRRGGPRPAAPAAPHRMARRGYLALQSWCFYSAVTWLPPTYVELGWDRSAAGYLGAAFSGAQVISGLLGPILSDRAPTCVGCSCSSRAGHPRLPRHLHSHPRRPLGVGRGAGSGPGRAAFSLALVLLVRLRANARGERPLTGMAFLFSYGVASVGPFAMGLVRDVTGGLSPVWLVLAAIGVVQGLGSSCGCVPRHAPRHLSPARRNPPWGAGASHPQ